jgi:RecA-family ATPase
MMAAPTGGSINGVASIDAILRLAHHYPVFPCLARAKETIVEGKPKTIRAKSPHIPNGFLKATQDESQIRTWWKRWPDALVGVPMGQVTGLLAIDYDPDKHTDDTGEWIELHTDQLMSARIHGTSRGGRHYLYRLAKGQRYRTGTDLFLSGKVRKGLDLRAEGGYIIWWPLHGGSVMNENAPLLPAALIEERSFVASTIQHTPRDEPSPEAWNKDREQVIAALAYVEPDSRQTWINMGLAIHLATGGNDEGFELWHAWSAGGITGNTPHSYAGLDDCRETWGTFKQTSERKATLGSLFHEAKLKGYTFPKSHELEDRFPPLEQITDDTPSPAETKAEPVKETYRRPMDWTKLEQDRPPERTWKIDHWLTTGPTLLAGAGGIGKTLIAQTIATALVIGQNFVDEIAEPYRVLFWACEDEHDELWRRQVAICDYFGISLASLKDKLIIEPRLGCDNTLYSMVFGRPAWTPLKDELRDQVNDYKADTVFLDNIAQTYGANENDRHHVTTFVNGIIGVGGPTFSPILMGHPSRGVGSEFSGSSAWENAVRMRWYMGAHLPDQEPKEGEEADLDPNIRYLAKRKTNYSVKDYRKLVWSDGVFKPEKQENGFSERYNYPLRKEGAIGCVLFALRKFNEQGMRVTEGKNSPDYLPKVMRTAKLAQDYTQKELAEAMVGLRLDGRIKQTKVGTYPNRSPMSGLAVADWCTK